MNLLKFHEWIDTRDYSAPVFLVQFPTNPNKCIVLQVTEVAGGKGTVTKYTINFYIKAEHPSDAIGLGTEIIEDLNMKTQVFIDNIQIILIKATTSIPDPLGPDSNGRHIVRVQFTMLVSPTDKLNTKE